METIKPEQIATIERDESGKIIGVKTKSEVMKERLEMAERSNKTFNENLGKKSQLLAKLKPMIAPLYTRCPKCDSEISLESEALSCANSSSYTILLCPSCSSVVMPCIRYRLSHHPIFEIFNRAGIFSKFDRVTNTGASLEQLLSIAENQK